MSDIGRRLTGLFYVPRSPAWLAALRLVTVVIVLVLLWPLGERTLLTTPRGLMHIPPALWHPVSLSWPIFLLGGPTDAILDALRLTATIAAVLVALGLFTTAASVVMGVAFLCHQGVGSCYGLVRALGTPIYLLALIGPTLDWGAAWSIDAWRRGVMVPPPDERYGARLRLLHALTAVLFFFAAVTKVANCGAEWLGGGILWRYIVWHHFMPFISPKSYDLWSGTDQLPVAAGLLLAHPVLPKLLELATLLFEGSFFVSFFWPRTAVLFVVAALGFHVGIHLAIPPVIGYSWLPLYIACLASAARPAPASQPVATRRSTAFDLVVAVTLLGETAACFTGFSPRWLPVRRAIWPFMPQVMFAAPLGPEIAIGEFVLLSADGRNLGTLGTNDLYDVRIFINVFDPKLDATVAALAAPLRCRLGLREGVELEVDRVVWTYEGLYAQHQRGEPLTPVRRTRLRTIPLAACAP